MKLAALGSTAAGAEMAKSELLMEGLERLLAQWRNRETLVNLR